MLFFPNFIHNNIKICNKKVAGVWITENFSDHVFGNLLIITIINDGNL